MQNNPFRHSTQWVLEAGSLGLAINSATAESAPTDSHDGEVAIATIWLVFYLVILGSSAFSSAIEIAGLY